MNTLNLFKILVLVSSLFVTTQTVWAQEIDDVEADMDTAISESDAAQSAEEYGRKREAEEKSKLSTAKKEAETTTAKAAVVKDASQKRLAELEKKTAAMIVERKQFDNKTAKAKEQIVFFETKVKEAEATLATTTQEKKTAIQNLKNAEATIAAKKKQLELTQAAERKAKAEKMAATRKLASIAPTLPGKNIVMAKTCPMHRSMDFASEQMRYLKKGEKVELAKVGNEGWFHARLNGNKGYMHKTCK